MRWAARATAAGCRKHSSAQGVREAAFCGGRMSSLPPSRFSRKLREAVLANGRHVAATLAGRDRGTNIVALRLEAPVEVTRPTRWRAAAGGLALAFGADPNGARPIAACGQASVRLAQPRGGHIDRRLTLDLRIGHSGGAVSTPPVILGMSTGGPAAALVIPTRQSGACSTHCWRRGASSAAGLASPCILLPCRNRCRPKAVSSAG